MSSTNGSEPVEPERRQAPNLKHPEVLVAEIERTREDLAVTLDAIADRVSPKRVADRTRKQVTDAVTTAREIVVEQAGVAKVRAAEAAGIAKVRASEAAGIAKVRASQAATGAREKVSGLSGQHAVGQHGGSVALGGSTSAATSGLPPASGLQADGLDLSVPPASTGTPPPAVPPTSTFPTATPTAAGPKPEVLAGGALGLLVLLLLRRRRTRRRAQRIGAVAALTGAGVELRNDFEKGRKKGRKKARRR